MTMGVMGALALQACDDRDRSVTPVEPAASAIAGRDGRDGVDGSDGRDGRDGEDGKDGQDGSSGKDGRDGKEGLVGRDGNPGKDGMDGKDGNPGRDGRDGKDGADGKEGPAGRDGTPGKEGRAGKDGMSGGALPHRTLQHSSVYAGHCAPENEAAGEGPRTGSLAIEKQWIRSHMDEVYLWRHDVPDIDPAAPAYAGPDALRALQAYFGALRSPGLLADGRRRDVFSGMVNLRDFDAHLEGDKVPGFGVSWRVKWADRELDIRVAYVQPGSEAAQAGMRRGDRLISADGVAANVWSVGLQAAVFPTVSDRQHRFVLEASTGLEKHATLTSGIFRMPVPLRRVLDDADKQPVGYLLFQHHGLNATAALAEAFEEFARRDIADLVIDLRYNDGGALDVASQLAYMIAGDARTQNKMFARGQGNQPGVSVSMPFARHACVTGSADCALKLPLPTLATSRVFVLTQAETCSASEALINGLRGIDVEVIQIGGTTCGKPYSFTGKANCGHAYLAIEYALSNDKGIGGYGNGLVPSGTDCVVDDDLTQELGDPKEALLAAALHYRAEGRCPGTAALTTASAKAGGPSALRRDDAFSGAWGDPLHGRAFMTTPR